MGRAKRGSRVSGESGRSGLRRRPVGPHSRYGPAAIGKCPPRGRARTGCCRPAEETLSGTLPCLDIVDGLATAARLAAQYRGQFPRQKAPDMGRAGWVGVDRVGEFARTEIDPAGEIDARLAGVMAKAQRRLVDRVDGRGMTGTVRPGDLLPVLIDEAAVHALLRDVDRPRAEIADQRGQPAQAPAVRFHLRRYRRREI